MSEKIIDPQDIKYFVKFRLRFSTITVRDQKSSGEEFSFQSQRCFLIPCTDTDQGVDFMDAWLPDIGTSPGTTYEVAAVFPQPIASEGKIGVRRMNNQCDLHHCTIISKGVEEDVLKFMKSGDLLVLEVLPKSQMHRADNMRESSGDYDLA